MKISQMNWEQANQISNWGYEEPYEIYSMDGSDECINELLNFNYFSVTDDEEKLIGYFCYGEAAQVPAGRKFDVYDDTNLVDIGLGIKPELCSKGLGNEFLLMGIEFGRNMLSIKRFRLTVAAFNERAIKVYQRVGFEKIDSFVRVTDQNELEFWVMIL